MAIANSPQGEAPQERALNPVLDLPEGAGAPNALLWDELAQEAKRYGDLVDRLKSTGRGAGERDALEGELLESLAHLRAHAAVLDEAVTDALVRADALEDAERG